MSRNKVAAQHYTAKRGFAKVSLYRGLVARVARDLGLSRSHVLRVSLGQRRSKHIEAALAREIRRVEQLARKTA